MQGEAILLLLLLLFVVLQNIYVKRLLFIVSDIINDNYTLEILTMIKGILGLLELFVISIYEVYLYFFNQYFFDLLMDTINFVSFIAHNR